MTTLLIILKVFVCCHLILQHVSAGLYEGQPRIVGGGPTTIDTAPFVVQILESGYFICAGTLVAENFVVSAAHCFVRLDASKLTVIGGATKRYDGGVRSKVSKVITPTDFNTVSANMDIAVLKLATPMREPSVKPIALCNNEWKHGDPVQVYGWGRTEQDSSNHPATLHTVTVNVVEKETCKELYSNRKTLTKAMFCGAALGKDACGGDSGGPALVNSQFCGVVSWGVGCGDINSPGVYTNVLEAKQFITNAMKQ